MTRRLSTRDTAARLGLPQWKLTIPNGPLRLALGPVGDPLDRRRLAWDAARVERVAAGLGEIRRLRRELRAAEERLALQEPGRPPDR